MVRSLQSRRSWHALLTIYAALIGIIFGFMVLAFPFGAYVVFNTELGDTLTHEFPLSDYLFITVIPVDLPFTLQLGEYFIFFWCLYLFFFALLMFGPKRNILQSLVGMVEKKEESRSNALQMVILWLAVLFVFSQGLELILEPLGVGTGSIEYPNQLLQFFDVTAAPLREELGFRVLLVGLPAFLMLGQEHSWRNFLKTLWNPARHLNPVNMKSVYILITITAVLFGLAHIFFGGGWSYGKVPQAAIGGWILGWLYYRYGLPAAVMLHWSTNYFAFSYGYFGSTVWGFSPDNTDGNPFLGSIDMVLTITGIMAIAIFLYKRIRDNQPTRPEQNSFKDTGII